MRWVWKREFKSEKGPGINRVGEGQIYYKQVKIISLLVINTKTS